MAFEYKPHGLYGAPIAPDRCKAAVHKEGRGVGQYQCSRKPWKDGWCKQHHPDTVAERRRRNQERYEKKRKRRWERSPAARLEKANEEIVRLKARVAELEQLHDVPYNHRVIFMPIGYHDVEEFYKEAPCPSD